MFIITKRGVIEAKLVLSKFYFPISIIDDIIDSNLMNQLTKKKILVQLVIIFHRFHISK